MKVDVQVHDLIQHKTTPWQAQVFHLHHDIYKNTLYHLFDITTYHQVIK